MKRVLLFTFMAAFMCAAQVSAKELRKIVFKVDQMECVNCENKVKKNIPFEKGVKKMETYSNCNLRCRENKYPETERRICKVQIRGKSYQ